MRWSGWRYAGAKWRMADDVIKHLAPTTMIVDLFAGSGALSIAAVRSGKYPPSGVVANDINNRMIRLLRVMRDRPEEFTERVTKTPRGRDEFQRSCDLMDDDDDLVAACAIFVVTMQSPLFLPNKVPPNGYRRPILGSRTVASGPVYRWQIFLDEYPAMQQEMLKVEYENLPWQKCVEQYGKRSRTAIEAGATILFLCDPPYRASGDRYGIDFDHDEFLSWARTSPNPVAILERADTELDLPGFERRVLQVPTTSAFKGGIQDALYLSPGAGIDQDPLFSP